MIERFLQFLLYKWQNRESLKTFGAVRDRRWRGVRAEHLKENSICAVCSTNEDLEVHHCVPFHIDKNQELNPDNLITLCQKNNCHLRFGHLYSFKSWNENIKEDAKLFSEKIKNRP